MTGIATLPVTLMTPLRHSCQLPSARAYLSAEKFNILACTHVNITPLITITSPCVMTSTKVTERIAISVTISDNYTETS